MSISTFFFCLFEGFFSLPHLFSGRLSDQIPVVFKIFTSFALALLAVLILYFIVNRKKQPIPVTCLGILGAGWGIYYYICRGGFGLFWPWGYEYERIREDIHHFESLLQRDFFASTPFADWLVPLLYQFVLVFSVLVSAALIIGIYNLKKRRQFSLRQTLIVAIPMVCILTVTSISVNILPSKVGDILRLHDFILPLLIAMTLWKKKPFSIPNSKNDPLPESLGDNTITRSE